MKRPRREPARPASLLLAVTGMAACRAGADKAPLDSAGPSTSNVLILLTDDIGVDKTAVYGEHPHPASTPNIDALAADGVLFRYAYAMPTCSPTRAALLTGRYPTRTGIGRWIYPPNEETALASDELTIPGLLKRSPMAWSTAAVGKWHLTGFLAPDPAGHPLAMGFDHFAGSMANPLDAIQSGNTPRSYQNWEKNTDGALAWTTTYMTTETIDDAIAMVGAALDSLLTQDRPPDELLSEPLPEDATDVELHGAMIGVLDDGIGRLMAAMSPDLRARTTVIYTSDNGTATEVDVIEAPWDPSRGKQTVYEGGVRVPLIVTGPLVEAPGSECDALVSVVDILPTIAELAEVDLDTLTVPSGEAEGRPIALDGSSLVPYLRDPGATPARDIVFAEQFYPNGNIDASIWRERMIRDPDWKLIERKTADTAGQLSADLELFRFEPGAIDEGTDLLSAGPLDVEARLAYDRLLGALTTMDQSLSYSQMRTAP